MVQWQKSSKRKASGGIRHSVKARDKKLFERGGVISETKIGADKRRSLKGMGNTNKVKLLQSKQANVVDEKGRTFKAELVTVRGNTANKLFVRRNIMTKGAVVEVKHGAENRLAKVTNRPGQTGTVEARLLPMEAYKEFEKKQSAESVKTHQKGDKAQNKPKEAEK